MTMTEAPLSYTIKCIDRHGFDEMFTIRGDDPADYFSKIAGLKKWLIANGYTPTGQGRRSPAANGSAPQAANGPVCQYHGPMKPSKFGGFYCPKKLHDGTYCTSKSDGQAPAPQPAPARPPSNGTPPNAGHHQAWADDMSDNPPPHLFDPAPPDLVNGFDSYYGAETN